jgi:hypothetical protein
MAGLTNHLGGNDGRRSRRNRRCAGLTLVLASRTKNTLSAFHVLVDEGVLEGEQKGK